MMSKTNNSGVYQLENGNWGYRFTLTENGHRRDIRRIKDNDGNVFTSKTAATRARSLALADYLDGQKKKQIKRKTVREIYQEYREKGSSSKKYQLFEYPLLGLDGASPAEKLPLLCHVYRSGQEKGSTGRVLPLFIFCIPGLFPEKDHSFSKASLPRPQVGQTQSAGTFSQGVPGATPFSGSPTAGS